jgi:HlyD family secretion protein
MRTRIGSRWPIAAAAAALGAAVIFGFRHRTPGPSYVTAPVTRGDILEVVGATGTLQAVTTVQVGSQVSGTIQSLHADFNSVVRKGQLIASLDPSSFEARIGQARANVLASRANVERARANVEDARQKLARAEALAAQDLLPRSELETARASHEGAAAELKASEAAVHQAEAALQQARVDLAHTTIEAPIDGVVISRSVDVGQTVAASLQAPVLFVIANDLTRMQVNASVDEADVGRVRPGQQVSFRVDAFPERSFEGRVEQVRLQPTTVQNVVTYNAIISVDNPRQLLLPGMTATVSVVVSRADDVLRVPAAALRFRPPGYKAAAHGADTPAARGDVRVAGRGRAGSTEASRPSLDAARGPSAPADAPAGVPATVFVPVAGGRPEPRRIRTGLSDGQFAEARQGLAEGDLVITGAAAAGAGPTPSASPVNPFNPQRQRRQR